MREFRVVRITNNLTANPECTTDTEEFPQLILELEEEVDTFILEFRNGVLEDHYLASEFFYQVDLVKFQEIE